jgi:nucleoside-diphosphate kinase
MGSCKINTKSKFSPLNIYQTICYTNHMRTEKTLVIIKPDGIQRNLVGEIISRYERVGLKLVAMKMMHATPDLIRNHYTLDPLWLKSVGDKGIKSYDERGIEPPTRDPLEKAKVVLDKLVAYMSADRIIAMVWQGPHAVKISRKIVGSTEPLASDVGTLRGDYVLDSYELAVAENRCVQNIVHASGSVKEAEDEIKHWFEDVTTI